MEFIDVKKIKPPGTSQYARSLIEASLDPLVTISPEGKITDVNKATVIVTGVSRENLINTDFSNYFTEPVKARDVYQRVFKEGSIRDYPLSIRHSSDYITDVLYNASIYKDDKGNVLGVFAAARDVTETKKVEKLLAELTDAKAKTQLELTDAKAKTQLELTDAKAKTQLLNELVYSCAGSVVCTQVLRRPPREADVSSCASCGASGCGGVHVARGA